MTEEPKKAGNCFSNYNRQVFWVFRAVFMKTVLEMSDMEHKACRNSEF